MKLFRVRVEAIAQSPNNGTYQEAVEFDVVATNEGTAVKKGIRKRVKQ